MAAMDFLMSERQQRIFAALFLHPDRSYSISDLLRIGGPGRGATQKIVSTLHSAEVIHDEQVGNQRRFKVNQNWPFLNEFHAICVKSFGLVDRLKEALAPVFSRIRLAFVFGSVAKGTEHSSSDIDLFAVGDIDLIELNSLLAPVEKTLGRSIDVNLYAPEDWPGVLKNSVIQTILRGPKIMVVGDEPTEKC